jgi:DNA-binding SARP family transcriptional activator
MPDAGIDTDRVREALRKGRRMTNTTAAESGPAVSLRILGAPEVWVGDRHERPPAGRCVWLLGGLALTPGQIVSERRLAEFIWGFHGTSTSSLRSAVSRLRSWLREVCGDALSVEYVSHGYRLQVAGHVRVDVSDFRRLIGEIDKQSGAEQLESLAAALGLWRGPILDGAPDALGQTAEAKFLRRDRLRAAARLVEAATAAGRITSAVELLWRLAADEPFDVATQALLLRTLGLAGLSSQIAQAFAVAERRFREEVRVPVPAKLVEAYRSAIVVASSPVPEALLAHAPAGDCDCLVEARSTCRPPRALSGSAGRETEYLQLRGYLGRSAAPAGLLVTGPAGSGKTALAARAAHAQAAAGGHRVLWASIDETTQADEVVSRFLLALGVPAERIPRSASLRVDALRDRLEEVPAALFLDGVSAVGQVLPFIPGTARSKLVVLSERTNLNLPGFASLALKSPRAGGGPAAGRPVLRRMPTVDLRCVVPPIGPVLVPA